MQSCHFSHIFANAHHICHCHAFNWPEHNQWSIRTYSSYANGRPKLLVWQWPFDEAVRWQCIRHRPIRVKNYCHVPILYRRHKLVKYDSRDGCSIYTEDFKLHYGSWLHEGCGADMQCVEGLDRSDQPGFVCRGDGPFLMKTKLIPADGIDIIFKIVSRLYDCYTTKYALCFAFDSHTNLCLAFKKTKAIITNMKFSYGKRGLFDLLYYQEWKNSSRNIMSMFPCFESLIVCIQSLSILYVLLVWMTWYGQISSILLLHVECFIRLLRAGYCINTRRRTALWVRQLFQQSLLLLFRFHPNSFSLESRLSWLNDPFVYNIIPPSFNDP